MSKQVFGAAGLAGLAGVSGVVANFFWGKTETKTGNSSSTGSSSPSSISTTGGASSGSVVAGGPIVNPGAFFKYGFPGPIHDLENRQEFISCYDRAKRNPYWVLEHLTAESLRNGGQVDRKKSVFKEDEQIPPQFRGRLKDYFRSGYDRGHQAPAANAKFNQLAMDETFYLTNMCPQVGDGFNRDYWAFFETFTRDLTKKFKNVRILTGPLYLPKLCDDGKYRVTYEVIGNPPNIAVPTHFFKLVVCDDGSNNGDLSVGAFVMPNAVIPNSVPLKEFQVPVEALERSSGLTLLQNVEPKKKKNLCREVECEIVVREFAKLPAPSKL